MIGFGHSIEEAETILSQSRKAIVFPHIHKTAGSTIRRAISEKFGEYAIPSRTVPERDRVKELAANGFFDHNTTFIVCGHVTEGVTDALKEVIPTISFTFLRDPVKRIESFYSYSRIRLGEDIDPKRFIDRFRPNHVLISHLDATSANRALDTFKSDYFMVGLTEQINLHFGVLRKLLRMPDERYESITVTRPEDKTTFATELGEYYRQRNSEECALYEAVAAAMKHAESAITEYTAPATLIIDANSYVNPTQINTNLDKNKDHISLFLTGKHLWITNRDTAQKFFDKCLTIDPRMSSRIEKFKKTINSHHH